MNKSFDMKSSNSHYLPKIKVSQSSNLKNKGSLHSERYRAQSHVDLTSTTVPLTRKLVNMDDIRNVNEYEQMNEKELLREHEKLLRIIKKFQEIIDIHLARKKREMRSQSTHHGGKKPMASKEDLLRSEVSNNKKIIENYQKEIKELESYKKQRKLNDVIQEKIEVNKEIAQLKKDIFNLKNDDNMAGRSLVEDRPIIEKELKEIEKDLKIELTKKHEYIKKIEDLNAQLAALKKECANIDQAQVSHQKESSHHLLMKLSTKKAELEDVKRQREQIEGTIQENMVSKAKRNKALTKQIQAYEKKMTEMKNKILQYKDKISRYQKAMDIFPKEQKPQHFNQIQQQGATKQ